MGGSPAGSAELDPPPPPAAEVESESPAEKPDGFIAQRQSIWTAIDPSLTRNSLEIGPPPISSFCAPAHSRPTSRTTSRWPSSIVYRKLKKQSSPPWRTQCTATAATRVGRCTIAGPLLLLLLLRARRCCASVRACLPHQQQQQQRRQRRPCRCPATPTRWSRRPPRRCGGELLLLVVDAGGGGGRALRVAALDGKAAVKQRGCLLHTSRAAAHTHTRHTNKHSAASSSAANAASSRFAVELINPVNEKAIDFMASDPTGAAGWFMCLCQRAPPKRRHALNNNKTTKQTTRAATCANSSRSSASRAACSPR